MTMAKNKHHDGSGPTQRQLRVGELIRRTLSDVLMRGDIHDPDLTAMSITVGVATSGCWATTVRRTPGCNVSSSGGTVSSAFRAPRPTTRPTSTASE
jgi:hypothetical protein